MPAYYTDPERRAMLDAAKIVGINVLRLMTDVTAGAISAMSRRDLGAISAICLPYLSPDSATYLGYFRNSI